MDDSDRDQEAPKKRRMSTGEAFSGAFALFIVLLILSYFWPILTAILAGLILIAGPAYLFDKSEKVTDRIKLLPASFAALFVLLTYTWSSSDDEIIISDRELRRAERSASQNKEAPSPLTPEEFNRRQARPAGQQRQWDGKELEQRVRERLGEKHKDILKPATDEDLLQYLEDSVEWMEATDKLLSEAGQAMHRFRQSPQETIAEVKEINKRLKMRLGMTLEKIEERPAPPPTFDDAVQEEIFWELDDQIAYTFVPAHKALERVIRAMERDDEFGRQKLLEQADRDIREASRNYEQTYLTLDKLVNELH